MRPAFRPSVFSQLKRSLATKIHVSLKDMWNHKHGRHRQRQGQLVRSHFPKENEWRSENIVFVDNVYSRKLTTTTPIFIWEQLMRTMSTEGYGQQHLYSSGNISCGTVPTQGYGPPQNRYSSENICRQCVLNETDNNSTDTYALANTAAIWFGHVQDCSSQLPANRRDCLTLAAITRRQTWPKVMRNRKSRLILVSDVGCERSHLCFL